MAWSFMAIKGEALKLYIDNRFRQALRDYMGEENLTQKELAKRFGITAMTVSRWMSGHTDRVGTETWSKMRPHLAKFMSNRERKKRGLKSHTIEVLSEAEVSGQSLEVEKILLEDSKSKKRVFKIHSSHDSIPCEKLIICQSFKTVKENHLMLYMIDSDTTIAWCEAYVNGKYFFSGEDKETAKIVEESSLDYIGEVIEIRYRNFSK